jgi:hypothetical protein
LAGALLSTPAAVFHATRALSRRQALIDAASAAFPPVVLFLLTLNDIVIRNVKELLYRPALMSRFLIAGVIVWAVGVVLIRRFRGRTPARLWLAIPLAVLVLDVAGGFADGWNLSLGLRAAAEGLVLCGAVAAVMVAPWPALQQAAALVGVALLAQGSFAHATFVRNLPSESVVASNRAPANSPPAPAADAPGNVYHILLDAYQSESYARSIGSDAATRYPGFTFYSRFNTNFPHTESSEPALFEGRFPTPGMSIEAWPQRALRDGFLRDLDRGGVTEWLYTYSRGLCPDYAYKCVASSDLEREANSTIADSATVDLWALRLMPSTVRALLRQRQPSGGFDRTVGFSITAALRSAFGGGQRAVDAGPSRLTALPRQYFNLQEFDELLADEERRPARGQYVYYHALIPHPEFIMDDRCEPIAEPRYGADRYWAFVACANLMIDRLVQRLRELDRLDDSLIIVHADHGDPQFLTAPAALADGDEAFGLDPGARTYQQPDATYRDFERFQSLDSATWRSIAVEVLSSGLLLVKEPHAHRYVEDTKPVQLLDIAPTVLEHVGRDTRSYPGSPISRVTAGREAVFYAHSRNFDGKFSKYRLTAQGWQFVEDVPVQP